MTFHLAYFAVVFDAAPLPAGFPGTFAIVTGYATTGETWTAAANAAADQALHDHLVARGVPHHRVTGRDSAATHREPGWAVACPLPVALALGRQFRQDAIYWVANDRLWVVSCGDTCAPALVGSFAARLTPPSVPDTPPAPRPG